MEILKGPSLSMDVMQIAVIRMEQAEFISHHIVDMLLELLINHGADVNLARTDNRSTPLYISSQKGTSIYC